MVEASSGKQHPEAGSFSLSHLAQPPASTHILPSASLANRLFSSSLGGSITSLSSVPKPAPLLLEVLAFKDGGRKDVVKKYRQLGDKQNKSGQRTPNEEELWWS